MLIYLGYKNINVREEKNTIKINEKEEGNLKGYLCMVLHTHLPFVNHPENDNYIEEEWLYEAITETYIPLLKYFNLLAEEKVKFSITMSLTPPLLEMLDSKVQQDKYIKYLKKHIELSSKEIERTKCGPNEENELAKYYYNRYSEELHLFKDVYKCELIPQFKKLQDEGYLEIITCNATHGFIPMLYTNERNIEVQIKYGVMIYEKYFGRKPRGMWLAECGYAKEVEKYLKKYEIEYFFTEMHGVMYANPVPVYGVYAPIVTPQGIAVFGRNVESTMRVWSNVSGYPGDSNYREFSRDIGFDLDYEYIKPYLTYDGVRIPIGIKYYSVSDKSEYKSYYNIQRAKWTAETHAYDYMQKTIEQITKASGYTKQKPPIIVSMQDSELYGHWWYEGPYWLYILIKKMYYDQNEIDFITPSMYLDMYPELQVCQPSISSWGSGGTNSQWAECDEKDVYIHLEILSKRMTELANNYQNEKDKLKIRALNQCARELLLLQTSDWYFNLTCYRAVHYSNERINTHIERFNKLYDQIINSTIDESFLKDIEWKDNIIKEINFRDYKSI